MKDAKRPHTPPAGLLERVLLLALLLAAFVRGLALLAHEPLLAIANDPDSARVQACVGVHPVVASSARRASSRDEVPLERHQFRIDADVSCDPTSEALLAFAAYPLMRAAASGSDDGTFSIRWLGFTKFGLLMLVAVVGTFALRRSLGSFAAVAFATCVVLVVTDPAVLLYAHGFHAEFASFLFLLASMVAMAVAGSDRPPGGIAPVVAALAVLLFVTSRVQHLADGFVLLALFGVACFLARRRDWLALLALTVASLLGFVLQLAYHGSELGLDSLAGRGLATSWPKFAGGFERLRPWFADGLVLPASQFTWARVLDDAPPLEYALFAFGPAVLVLLAALFGVFRWRPAGTAFAWLALALLPYPMMAAIMLGGAGVDVAKEGFLVLACLLCFWALFAVTAIAFVARLTSDTIRGTVFRALDAARARGRVGAISAKAATAVPQDPASRDRTRTEAGTSDSNPS